MIYEQERQEKKENRDIIHLPMPVACWDYEEEMYHYLDSRGLSPDVAKRNGWYPTVSRGERIVIPCINSAKFNYWQARAMRENFLRYDSPAIPRKDSIVFLWPSSDYCMANDPTIIICEGPMDALAAAEKYPAIAIMGGCPSDEVVEFIAKKITEFGISKVCVIPDKDNLELISYFSSLISIVSLGLLIPTHKDLADMPRWERRGLLNQI